ncbi:hypothetical protein H6P81_001820 [Aristolochia fimbriata]|uniref:Uncharacterized protein n=1 Tax=Aristolochia fimbriata TaxID=158543 RepID=A0AAV7F824_ARIFI|nr:hypothetical protein H6P81_001820 [Aristolochia fimbriata]
MDPNWRLGTFSRRRIERQCLKTLACAFEQWFLERRSWLLQESPSVRTGLHAAYDASRAWKQVWRVDGWRLEIGDWRLEIGEQRPLQPRHLAVLPKYIIHTDGGSATTTVAYNKTGRKGRLHRPAH